MKIEIAPHERMSETGSSLLRLIQNNEMPMIDLLVREAVQNSLDAALPGEGFVQVDFNIRNFSRQSLAVHFDGIQDRLNELYPDDEYRLLEIRDSNTYGLTGPLHDGDLDTKEFGNLIKLVYQIGMPQQKEGSGGSWGLGKTVYFRLGIGLVIYYSRIYNEVTKNYESRLAACLVEDENGDRSLLKNKGRHRGIAWWGQEAPVSGSTMPVTDESEIHEILEVLGSKPFSRDQTGTAVIIPFLRDDLRNVFIDDDEDAKIRQPVWWESSDEDYIKVALQRWYAPRLMNPKYPNGRWLRATVNGQGITRDSFLPVFQVVQELYNIAANSDKTEAIISSSKEVQRLPVNLRSTFLNEQTAGWVAFAKYNKAELKMTAPHNNPSPWIQVFGRNLDFEYNPALISFTRKPGMIVGYEYTGKWVDGIPRTSEDEYLIGIFVANSKNNLLEKNPKTQLPFSLEEYVRGCEKADHTSWNDWAPNGRNPLIIDRIQRNLIRGISRTYVDNNQQKQAEKNERLGRLLANVLLPPEGFGKSSDRPLNQKKPGSRGISSTGRYARITNISSPKYENGLLRLDFEIFSGKDGLPFELNLKVMSEGADITADSWEEDLKLAFPLSIQRIIIHEIEKRAKKRETFKVAVQLDSLNDEEINQDIHFKLIYSKSFSQCYGVRIENAKNEFLTGSVWISSNDRDIRAALHADTKSGGVNQ